MKQMLSLSCALFLSLPGLARADDGENRRTYQIPYRLTETQHILIRAKINGKGPFNFILDTGAPALFVATSVGKELGIEPDRNGWGLLKRFEIEGGAVLRDVKGKIETPFQLEGMNGLGLAGVPLHGMMGYTILARFRIEFDFTKDKMTWTELDFRPPTPFGIGARGGAGGLDALGSIMKLLGGLLGTREEPVWAFRGFLGVELANGNEGAEVTAVLADSPAAKAGIQVGDEIVLFQEKKVRSHNDVTKLAAALPAGKTATLTVRRGNQTKQFTVKLADGV